MDPSKKYDQSALDQFHPKKNEGGSNFKQQLDVIDFTFIMIVCSQKIKNQKKRKWRNTCNKKNKKKDSLIMKKKFQLS